MVGFSFGVPEDPEERDSLIQLAITLARAKFGEPTEEQAAKEFIRLLYERSNQPEGEPDDGG